MSKNIKKTNIFIAIAVIILVTLGWMIFCKEANPPVSHTESETFQSEDKEELTEDKEELSLIIDNGKEPPLIFKSEFRKGITVFDLLKEGTGELDLVLKTKTYDFGVLIEAIGDKENGEHGNYWLYYVNGEMPAVSVDKKEINLGDKIEFKFEKSPF